MKLWTVFAFFGLFVVNLSGCFSVTESTDERTAEPAVESPVEEIEDQIDKASADGIDGKDFFNGLVDVSNYDWYVGHLKAMGEDPLKETVLEDRLRFRFLWLREFHEPYMVRGFMGEDSKMKLHMRGLDGVGGYEPGQKIHDTFSNLTTGQTDEILTQLRALEICEAQEESIVESKGSQWVFEIYNENQYCLVDIRSPAEDSKFREFGLHLLKTSRVKTWEIDVY